MRPLKDDSLIKEQLKQAGFTTGRMFYHRMTEQHFLIDENKISIRINIDEELHASIDGFIIWSFTKGITGEFKP